MAQEEVMFSPISLSWAAPVLALLRPLSIPTAELCATLPAPPEQWTMGDILAGLNPATHDFEDQKLQRMARAAIWPTYCEFSPAPDPTAAPVGAPHFLADYSFGTTQYPDLNGYLLRGAPSAPWIVGPNINEAADFFSVLLMCQQSSTDFAYPALHVVQQNGDNYSNTALGPWPTSAGHQSLVLVLVANTFPQAGVTHRWAISLPSSGVWVWRLSAWTLTAPSLPAPWPAAPAVPPAGQFSDECVAALCRVGTDWPTAYTDIQTLLSLEQSEPVPSPVVVPDPVAGTHSLDAPANAVGLIIDVLTVPDNIGIAGHNPGILWNAGFATLVSPWGKFPGIRIKERPHLIRPLPPQTSGVLLDLASGVTAQVTWLVTPP